MKLSGDNNITDAAYDDLLRLYESDRVVWHVVAYFGSLRELCLVEGINPDRE